MGKACSGHVETSNAKHYKFHRPNKGEALKKKIAQLKEGLRRHERLAEEVKRAKMSLEQGFLGVGTPLLGTP